MTTRPRIDRRPGRARVRLAVVGLLALGLSAGCRPEGPPRVALLGATVVDGTGGPPLRDAVVLVQGARIEAIAPRAGFDLPRGTREVDVTGRWIIPGLIDAHAHAARWAFPRYLAWGVTSVRDVHGSLDSVLALRDAANLHAIAGPRLFVAGAMLDAPPATYPDALPAGDADAARRAVDRLAVAGVDFVKTYTRITPALLRAVVDEAEAFHLPVTSHLGLTDAVRAAELGVSAQEHLSGIPEAASREPEALFAAHRSGFFAGWTRFERSWAELDSAALRRVAERLAGQGVLLVPTLVLHETYSRLDDPALFRDSALRAVPDSEQTRWNVPDLIRRAGWTPEDFAAFRASRPAQNLFLRLFRAAGGTVAAGSDAANQMLVPGLSAHQEMELLVSAGLPPEEALAAATVNGARLLGADSLGVLAPGKAADLVVLRANPLQDIRNTRTVEQVMVRGNLMRADSIRTAW